jgi:hypothetical protein
MRKSTKPLPMLSALLGAALLLALGAGCTTSPSPQVNRLLAHPEFRHAAQAAPQFTADCLNTIAALESRK